MIGGVEVFCRVLVLRRVTAADVTARHAKTQVHPRVANLQAVFTTLRARSDFANLIQMCAIHSFTFSISIVLKFT